MGPKNKEYEHLPSMAYLASRVQPRVTVSPLIETHCPYYDEYRKLGICDTSLIEENATLRGVKPTTSNIQTSWEKCDQAPTYPTDPLMDRVMKMAEVMLEKTLTSVVSGPNDHFEINSSSSPGKFWKQYGCDDKAQAIDHPYMKDAMWSISHPPLVDYNGKLELIEKESIISENKIRGTFNPPMDFVMKEKLLFDNQNQNILDDHSYCWIQYGVVKQNGGFNKIGKDLERFEIIDEDDVTGFDRIIFLGFCLYLRLKFLAYPTEYAAIVAYVLAYTLNPWVVCADGVVRMRKTGNISGSNNTTTNNSIAHQIILIRFIFNLWIAGIGRDPTIQEIIKNHKYKIFSDDALGGHNIKHLGLTIDDFWRIKQATYAEFGMKLKQKQHMLTTVQKSRISSEHSFLGSSFHFDNVTGMYVPYPRINKLASSVKYSLKKSTIYDTVSKMIAITTLSAPCGPINTEMESFLQFLLNHRELDKTKLPSEWLHWADTAKRGYNVWFNVLLGRESSLYNSQLILERMVEGFKINYDDEATKYKYKVLEKGNPTTSSSSLYQKGGSKHLPSPFETTPAIWRLGTTSKC